MLVCNNWETTEEFAMQPKKTLGVLALARQITAVVGIVAAGSLGMVQPVFGATTGTFTMLMVSTHSYTTVKQPEVTTFGGGLNGVAVIVESSGDPFTKGTHGDTTCVVYGRQTPKRFRLETTCTFSDARGENKLYMSGRRTGGGVETGGSGGGTLDGGTGRFANVRGSCDYDATYRSNKRVLTTVNCSWEQP